LTIAAVAEDGSTVLDDNLVTYLSLVATTLRMKANANGEKLPAYEALP